MEFEPNEAILSATQERKRRIVMGVISIAAASLVLAGCTSNEAQQLTEVIITKPTEGSTVEHIDTVEGKVTRLRLGHTVWVLITDKNDNVYHPQAGPATVRAGGRTWERTGVRFGSHPIPAPGEDIEHRISTAVANHRGTQELQDYLEQARSTNTYPGFTTLPDGVSLEHHTVKVYRNPPKRPTLIFDFLSGGLARFPWPQP